MTITTKKVARYILLPGVVPRLKNLLGPSLGSLSFFMACICRTARLLPPHHPYLAPANMGRYSMRHVLLESARHLSFRKENIDQIVILGLLSLGLLLLFSQLALLALALFAQAAHAQVIPMPTNFAGFFGTPLPQDDIAFVLLDRIFGAPGIFTNAGGVGTCVAQNLPCFDMTHDNPGHISDGPWPFPFHVALHGMFRLYSTGLLVVAMFIFAYFIVAIVLETAESGTPFGQRFNHVWAPLRMVTALGLLIPIADGMNSAQYVVLYAAKWGSSFATNGWNLFVSRAVINNPAGMAGEGGIGNMVATPNPPELTSFVQFMTTTWACRYAYLEQGREIRPYLVKDTNETVSREEVTTDMTYGKALRFYNNGDILVRFGECLQTTAEDGTFGCLDPLAGAPVYPGEAGFVKELCGEMIMPTSSLDPGIVNPAGGIEIAMTGAGHIQELYWELLKRSVISGHMVYDEALGEEILVDDNTIAQWGQHYGYTYANNDAYFDPTLDADREPTTAQTTYVYSKYKSFLHDVIDLGVFRESANTQWQNDLQRLGWGGAGLWYSKIAQMNGAITVASFNLPYPIKYPRVMEAVRAERLKQDNSLNSREAYRPFLSDNQEAVLRDDKIVRATWHAYDLWSSVGETTSKGDVFTDTIQSLFGLNGLYSMTSPQNLNVHPLAQLVSIGRGLVESSIRNLAGAVGGGVLAALLPKNIGPLADGFSSFMSSIALVGLSAGFILFYVVPFMPFIYFFFAVGNWVKGLFEAMVGVPLWALAHIRIDGDGLPGSAAMNGYYMILEIFLRPILTVFGLLAGLSIFAAQVRVLHEIWGLVISNVGGFDTAGATAGTATGSLDFKRDIVDVFFFNVVYAIIVYMMGTASFKLTDEIPNGIMRWMGAQGGAFSDYADDPAQNLVGNLTTASQMMKQTVEGAQGQGRKALGKTTEGLAELMKRDE